MSLAEDTDAIVRNLARVFAMQGRRREVALLAKAQAEFKEIGYDSWNGGTYTYDLILCVQAHLYVAIEKDIESLESEMLSRLSPLLRGYPDEFLAHVVISMELSHDDDWRSKALDWVESEKPHGASNKTPAYDYFICHASEDKSSLVSPLAAGLKARGTKVWFDDFALEIGDGLRRSIDKGLARSRYGIVVLSHAFFSKEWPQYELDGLTSRQMAGTKVVLPIWHGVTRKEVEKYSPSLADTLAYVSANMQVSELVDAFVEFIESSRA